MELLLNSNRRLTYPDLENPAFSNTGMDSVCPDKVMDLACPYMERGWASSNMVRSLPFQGTARRSVHGDP